MNRYPFLLLVIIVFISCRRHHAGFSAAEKAGVTDSVSRLATNIARDISAKGPAAWINYFEDTPEFFMANEGQLAFKDYQSAKSFIVNTVVKIMPRVSLRWSHLRIDPLSLRLASIGADFHEDQTDAAGNKRSIDGYFTALAHNDGYRWRLRNCHWSVKAPDQVVK